MDIRKILNIYSNEIEIQFELNNSTIILMVKDKINSHTNAQFIEKYNYESIKKISNYFNLFENLKEIYEDITNHLEKKEFNYIKENNKISLFIKTKVGIKNIEIPFICTKYSNNNENINKNEDTNINYNNISNINEKINKIENNINKIFKLLNKINIPNIPNELDILKKDNFFDVPSLICEQNIKINFLKNLLPNKKLTLLYRATKDGDSFNNFHSKCDNQGETVTLFKTIDGRKFGGHMNQSILKGHCDWYNKNDEIFFIQS